MCPCSARARTSTETAIRKPDHHLGEDFCETEWEERQQSEDLTTTSTTRTQLSSSSATP